MKDTESHSAWNQLVRAARQQHARNELDDAAPFGFSTRVISLWRETRDAERRLALWQRISWRAAMGTVTLCLMVAFITPSQAASSALLQPPDLPFPGLELHQ